jgi:hypothetical protein
VNGSIVPGGAADIEAGVGQIQVLQVEVLQVSARTLSRPERVDTDESEHDQQGGVLRHGPTDQLQCFGGEPVGCGLVRLDDTDAVGGGW